MPALVTSPSHVQTATSSVSTHNANTPSKKKRIVRRRGRKNDIASDDEIERELGTDSESEDEPSSLDSASDSDTEPASEDVVPNGHSRAFTPNTSQSSDRDLASKETPHPPTPFFAPTETWSEMVAAETANGPADLPVIDFANFDGKAADPPTSRPRKSKKSVKTVHPPSAVVAPQLPAEEDPAAKAEDEDDQRLSVLRRSTSKSTPPTRLSGQSARQAYQQRLENDPSYVPVVGGFWGHDDRLLDKDLRSLSGWWRGRWNGRGRGRGFIRGRGRSAFVGSSHSQPNGEFDVQTEPGMEVAPIDQKWTHDGFEEMKEREEDRRAQRERVQQSSPNHRQGNMSRGRSFTRGGFVRGFSSSTSKAFAGTPGRIWFQMKPELMWTKQHEAFLHWDVDPTLKPRPGQGMGIQVKLPGKPAKIARAPPRSWKNVIKVSIPKPSSGSSDVGDKVYAVRLPKGPDNTTEVHSEPSKEQRKEHEKGEGKEITPIEEVFKVRPALAPREPILPQPPSTNAPNAPRPSQQKAAEVSGVTALVAQLEIFAEQPSSPPAEPDPVPSHKTEETATKRPAPEVTEEVHTQQPAPTESDPPIPPPRPTVQPAYTPTPPVSQPSPVYGSPFGYVPALPPGIALNQHGVPYELSTGRPVYLPPPPPMYNPRPIMHSHMPSSSHSYVPTHTPHHSTVSPDFLSQSPASHTPPMNGFIDPSTGTPIFSFPRQTTRVKISAPSSESGSMAKSPKPSSSGVNGMSTLRNTAAAFEPSVRSPEPLTNGYFPALNGTHEAIASPIYSRPADAAVDAPAAPNHHQAPQDRNPMMAYSYPQPYYYPEPYYNPYMDMSQVGQYEMYPPPSEGYVPPGAVYY